MRIYYDMPSHLPTELSRRRVCLSIRHPLATATVCDTQSRPSYCSRTGVRIVQNGRSTGRADGLTNLNKSMQYVLINCLRATLNGHLVGIEINDVKNPIQPTHISATGKLAPGPKVKYINRADSVPYVRSTTSPYLIRVLGGRFFLLVYISLLFPVFRIKLE